MTYPGHTTNLLPISATTSWILISYLVVIGPVALLSLDLLSGEQNNPSIRHESLPFESGPCGRCSVQNAPSTFTAYSLHKYILIAYCLPGSEGDIRNLMNKIYSLVLFSRRGVSEII